MSKRFIASYPFRGARWGLDIMATDADEAAERVKALCWAQLDGELMATIPAAPGSGLFVRLIVWLRNCFA